MADTIAPDSLPGRLDSWKEIAAYLKRDVTTVQRWERREGLPVHRLLHERQGSVYAYVAELEQWAESRRASAPAPRGAKSRRAGPWVIAGAAVLIAAGLGAVAYWRGRSESSPDRPQSVDITIPAPAGRAFGRSMALSPDGQQLAIIVRSASERTLWLRGVYSRSAVAFPGTEGAHHPFWSPDGREIGFFSEGALKAVAVSGGMPRVICAARGGIDASWSTSGTIVFSGEGVGLAAVSAMGGEIRPFTALAGQSGETAHIAPHFLPDGRHVLFLADADTTAGHATWVADLEGGSRQRLAEGIMSQSVFSRGHLLYVRGGAIHARPFDAARRVFTGDEFVIVGDVRDSEGDHTTVFSVSAGGVVAFWPAEARRTRLTWFDEGGRITGYAGIVGEYEAPSIAPDGRRVAVARYERAAGNKDVWVLEHDGDPGRALTMSASIEDSPVWSPDGRTIAFASNRDGTTTIYFTPSDGSGPESRRDVPGVDVMPLHWDRRVGLLFLHRHAGADGWDLWVHPSAAEPVVSWRESAVSELAASVSPDGRWVAYGTNEGSVFVEPFAREAVTGVDAIPRPFQRDAAQPRWSPDGNALYSITYDEQLIRIPVDPTTGQPDRAGTRILFRLPPTPQQHRVFDVTLGGRILVNTLSTTASPGTIAVTTRWETRASR